VFSIFDIHSLETFLIEHHSLCFHELFSFCGISVLRVICVAGVVVSVVITCYYVPHWHVCLYSVGPVVCVSLIIMETQCITLKLTELAVSYYSTLIWNKNIYIRWWTSIELYDITSQKSVLFPVTSREPQIEDCRSIKSILLMCA
jgi:hypothetical protein